MVLILVIVFFAGTFGMNFQITSALMATEVFGKGAERVRPARHRPGGRLADRRAARRPPGPDPAPAAWSARRWPSAWPRSSPALMPTYLAFALLAPVIGFCTLTMLNSANATMQLETDPAMRGRVMALYMTIFMGGTPLGAPSSAGSARLRGPLDAGRRRRADARRRGALGAGRLPRLDRARRERFDPCRAARVALILVSGTTRPLRVPGSSRVTRPGSGTSRPTLMRELAASR